jgi:SAM-dependent methyltransferase
MGGLDVASAHKAVYGAYPFPGYMDTVWPAYHNIAQTVERVLPKGSRVLDFGSGGMDKTALLSAMGYKMYAHDDLKDDWHRLGDNLDKLMAFAKQFEIEFHPALDFAPKSLDMVMVHDVLEHFDDSPRELLNRLLGFVRTGGYLFVTVPNAANIRKRISALLGHTIHPPYDLYYWCSGEWRGHVREYVKDDLVRLGRNLELSNVEVFSAHHMIERKVPKMARPVYRVVTATFSGWRDTWCLIASKPADWKPQSAKVGSDYFRLAAPYTTYRYS